MPRPPLHPSHGVTISGGAHHCATLPPHTGHTSFEVAQEIARGILRFHEDKPQPSKKNAKKGKR